MYRLVSPVALLVLAMSMLIGAQAWASSFDTLEGAKSVIENVVLDQLPGPTGDLVNAVRAMPSTTKTGLILWLNRKMANAAVVEDWRRHDRYLAFYTCVSKGACADLRALQRQTSGGGGHAAEYEYLGCFQDNSKADPQGTQGRVLDGAVLKAGDMTTEKCIAFCGTTPGTENASNCNMSCSGDSTQTCGGTWANSVYRVK
jgi:hypothetical protein